MRHALALLLAAGSPALADPPAILDATLRRAGGTWTISVTLAHPDTGWDHYADGWRAEAPDGTVLGTRELLHPHVTEQPFTRSLAGLTLPHGLPEVHIRARCNLDGWSDTTRALPLAD